MNRNLHAHVPWRQIEQWLPLLIERRIQPEIGLQGADLDHLNRSALERVAAELHQAELTVTVHAPFLDLNPGALDSIVREATRRRLVQALDAASILGAKLMVVHPGYDDWHYDHNPQLWLDHAIPFFRELLPCIELSQVRIGIENIFETQVTTLIQLVTAIDHPLCGYCFDVGHWNLFAENARMQDWLAAIEDKLYHLHLHDNFGRMDQHLALGKGNIDFTPLNSFLSTLKEKPSMALEAHRLEDLELSLQALPVLLPASC